MPDIWTALSFDSAVMTYGIWAENRMQERWSDGSLKYTLEDILCGNDEAYQRRKNQEMYETLFVQGDGMGIVVLD
jgi:hypothetical protein